MRTTAIVYVQADTFGGLAAEVEAVGSRMHKSAPVAPISVSHAVEVTATGTLYTAILIYEIDPRGVDLKTVFDK